MYRKLMAAFVAVLMSLLLFAAAEGQEPPAVQDAPEPVLLRIDLTGSFRPYTQVLIGCREKGQIRRVPIGSAAPGGVTDMHLPVGELYACSDGALVFQYEDSGAGFPLTEMRQWDQESGLEAILICPGAHRTEYFRYPQMQHLHFTCEMANAEGNR